MMVQAILIPLFVQVALTFAIGFWMAAGRVRAIRSGEVRHRDIALREPNWPPRLMQLQNAYLNQMEMPLLFYVLVVLLLFTKNADLVFVLLAWVYVALRLLHAYVFVTTNHVPHRGPLFIASVIVLFVMWVIFAIRILLLA